MTVRRLLHIAPCLLLLLLPAFLCACTEEEAVVPAAPARTLTVDLGIALQATVTLIVAGTLAGFFPARKATKIRPIEALRAE